jgi:hypothetical protein
MGAKQEWLDWVTTRPKNVQDLIAKYPPGQYMIKPDAPYGVSCPGTMVTLYSYGNDGMIGVVVKPEDKLPEALEFERELLEKHGRLHKLKEIQGSAIQVSIDPQYMELILPFVMED